MAFTIGIIAVVEIVAGKIGFVADKVVVVYPAAPDGFDTVAVGAAQQGGNGVIIINGEVDIAAAALLQSAHLAGKIEHVHKRKALGIGVIALLRLVVRVWPRRLNFERPQWLPVVLAVFVMPVVLPAIAFLLSRAIVSVGVHL